MHAPVRDLILVGPVIDPFINGPPPATFEEAFAAYRGTAQGRAFYQTDHPGKSSLDELAAHYCALFEEASGRAAAIATAAHARRRRIGLKGRGWTSPGSYRRGQPATRTFTSAPRPADECPDGTWIRSASAAWLRRVVEVAGYAIESCTGSAWIGVTPRTSFYIWSTDRWRRSAELEP